MSSFSDMVVAIATAGGALATIGGGGIAFVWNKIDGRIKALEARQVECERRERRSRKQVGLLMSAVEILLAKLQDLAPDAPVIARARELLAQHRRLELHDHDDEEPAEAG